MSLVGLLIFLAIITFVIWIFESLPIPANAKLIARIGILLFAVVWLLQRFAPSMRI